MANAEISILGRDAHAIESTRSTFCLQSLMLILCQIYLFICHKLFERECMCESTNPLAYFLLLFSIQSTYLHLLYLHLLFTFHCIYLFIALTTIISISSPSYTIRIHHHPHLHLILHIYFIVFYLLHLIDLVLLGLFNSLHLTYVELDQI